MLETSPLKPQTLSASSGADLYYFVWRGLAHEGDSSGKSPPRAGTARREPALFRERLVPAQPVGERKQRIGGAVHHGLGNFDHAPTTGTRDAAQQVERLSRPQPVPFRENANRLLYPDPGAQRVLKLRHRHREAGRLVFLGSRRWRLD